MVNSNESGGRISFPEEDESDDKQGCCSWALGLFFVALMAICWALEAELTQSLQVEGSLEYYPKPLFIGYLTRCAYSFWLVPWILWRLVGTCTGAYKPSDAELNIKKETRMALWSFPMMILMFFNGYTWYLSLANTPVSVNTVIYNCCTVLVFILSIPILNEGISLGKLIAVALSVGGILMIFFAPSSDSGVVEVTWYGYTLVIISVIIYAFEEVMYKLLFNYIESLRIPLKGFDRASMSLWSKDDSYSYPNQSSFIDAKAPELGVVRTTDTKNDNTSTFMLSAFFVGCCGVCNAFTIVWLVVLWDYMGWETFEWPTPSQTNLLLVNCVLDSLLFLSVFAATAFTTPLITSIGSLLVIPVTLVMDYFLHDFLPSMMIVGGILLIVAGFILIVLSGTFSKTFAGGFGRLMFGECFLKNKEDGGDAEFTSL